MGPESPRLELSSAYHTANREHGSPDRGPVQRPEGQFKGWGRRPSSEREAVENIVKALRGILKELDGPLILGELGARIVLLA